VTIGVGLHRIGKAEYLADPCERPSLNPSTATAMLTTSPAKAREAHPRFGGKGKDPTEAMERGNAVEALLGAGDTDLVCLPDVLPNAKGIDVPTNDEFRMESAKEWKAGQEAQGRQVVKRAKLDEWTSAALAIGQKLQKQHGIDIGGAETQVTAVWEEKGGVLCRTRLDLLWLKAGIVRDLKVCESVHPDAIQAKFESFGYDVQRAAHISALETLYPELAGRITYEFIFCEPFPPYEIVIATADGEMRALGDFKWRRACELWRNCLTADKWPGYSDIHGGPSGRVSIGPKAWAMAKAIEKGHDVGAEAA
jgi:hypothetical protein